METQSSYDQFNKFTIVSADTGDVEIIKKLKPLDATTNPTLILKSVNDYKDYLLSSIDYSCKKLNSKDKTNKELIDLIISKVCVTFGASILNHIEGVVSTEIDARLSYDKDASVKKAKEIIQLYEEINIPRSRVLIKLCATWEGILAAEELEKEGICCNLTLVFSILQAVACAERGITLISPFVGRVNDFYIKETGKSYKFDEEPGVILVKDIFNYFKKYEYKTIIMGASLRTSGSCYELSGCDKLTIPPAVIENMKSENAIVKQKLCSNEAKLLNIEKISTNEEMFKSGLSSDKAASSLLSKGIEAFASDIVKLEEIIKTYL